MAKKRTKWFLGAGAALAGAWAFLVTPGTAPSEKRIPFYGRYFAHRGLHSGDGEVPENSMAAFRRAEEKGYGIEMDLQLTLDEQVVVFHDDSLKRMCGADQDLRKLTWDEIRELTLPGGEERIPLFEEVNRSLQGKVPLILELKRGDHNALLCKKTLELMRKYPGEYCVESFDPTIVRWWKKNAPDILRGQLAADAASFSRSTFRPLAFGMSKLLFNFAGRPQFIAYKITEKRPLILRLVTRMGAMPAAWTSTAPGDESDNDAVIFEGYLPPKHYK